MSGPRKFIRWFNLVAGWVKDYTSDYIRAADVIGLDPIAVRGSYAATITGDGTTAVFNIDHALGELKPLVFVRDSTGNQVMVDNQATTANRVVLTFDPPPDVAATFTVRVI